MRPSTPQRSTARRGAAAGLAAALLVAGLGACTPKSGSAAVVGDDRITVDDVQADTRELLELAEELGAADVSTADLNRRQVSRLVTQTLLREAAARRGVTATDAEVDALVRQSLGGRSREDFVREVSATELVPVSDFDSFVEAVVLNQKLLGVIAPGEGEEVASAALLEELRGLSDELGTTVNPRYGTWDPATLGVSLPPDDLSTPAAPGGAEVTSGTSSAS